MKLYPIRALLIIIIIIGGIFLTLLIFPNFWLLLLIIWIVIEILMIYIFKIWNIDKKNEENKI